MKRLAIVRIAVLSIVVAAGAPAAAQEVTAGAGGLFPADATFSGVKLEGLKFGAGVTIAADGTAEGQFQATLTGASLLGVAQTIEVEGKATAGSSIAEGSATISGTCTIDMGDGTLPLVNVPFTAAITAADGTATLALTLGTTSIPAATVNEGGVTIKE